MACLSRVVDRVVDAHSHLWSLDDVDAAVEKCREVGFERMNLACTCGRENVNRNPAAFVAKARHPELFTVFGGLDHSGWWSEGAVSTPSLPEQVDRLVAIGADGVKLLETKPTSRRGLPIPIDDEYFEGVFARVEQLQLPLLWHVADPEEFWDPAKTPDWARSSGWGYDDSFVAKEALYGEVDNVLSRHPDLRVIFAHFYFLSADLPRAAELLDRFHGVCLDVTPGIEMCYNLSADPAASREFFGRYADRIIFGTDIMSGQVLSEARARADIIRRWLETDEVFTVPPQADRLLGKPEDGRIVGLALPTEALEKIYVGNFERLAGRGGRPLDVQAAVRECRRLAEIVARNSGTGAGETEAGRAARILAET